MCVEAGEGGLLGGGGFLMRVMGHECNIIP